MLKECQGLEKMEFCKAADQPRDAGSSRGRWLGLRHMVPDTVYECSGLHVSFLTRKVRPTRTNGTARRRLGATKPVWEKEICFIQINSDTPRSLSNHSDGVRSLSRHMTKNPVATQPEVCGQEQTGGSDTLMLWLFQDKTACVLGFRQAAEWE